MWQVKREVMLIKAIGSAVCLGLTAYFAIAGDWRGILLALPAAVALGALALRDVLAPVRLAADEHGLTMIAGFAGTHHVPWEDVMDIRVDVRRRLSSRTELLEIHTEHGLQVFSAYDLGVPCPEALAELRRLQAHHRNAH